MSSASQPQQPSAFDAGAYQSVLASRLLRALEPRLAVGGPVVCECWDEEVCVVCATARDGSQRLAYLSIDAGHPEEYGVLLDVAGAEAADRRTALDFETLCGVVATHLRG